MKMKRIISALLAVITLMGAYTIMTSAEEVVEGHVPKPVEGWKTSNSIPTLDYFTGQGVEPVYTEDKVTHKKKITGYKGDGKQVVYSPEDKLATMDKRYVKDGYELYVDAYSGEVATRCIATGEILFSNPYTVGQSAASATIKTQLMSQLAVTYTDIELGDDNTYYSYEWAAQRGQVLVRNIKNGIRVEYTIGREEARMLVPRCIEKSSFETKIVNIMKEAVQGDIQATHEFNQLMAYYQLYDISTIVSDKIKDDIIKEYPVAKKMAIYVIDGTTAQSELAKLEQRIKTYCPDYSYEDLDEDHLKTEYESEDKNPPLFKMALEYSLDKDGMTVRLPANGIRFNEALYQLKSIEILPYMGAGSNAGDNWADNNFAVDNSGYTFYPDGSGTLFDFEKVASYGTATTVTGKVYGEDFAYHTISGSTHQEVIRYPVFGIVHNQKISELVEVPLAPGEEIAPPENDETTEGGENADGENTEDGEDVTPGMKQEIQYHNHTSGFVAFVEEGDALLELSAYHAIRTSEYNTIRMKVYPRPQDTYNVADAISVGSNSTWTVVSSRKYTGNYKIKYVMLTSEDVAKEKGIENYYDTSYVGMAKAYREYLENAGVLTRLTADDVSEDLPLYIETFGAIWSTKKVLSIPVDVTIPLTSFDDIATIYNDLSQSGIKNINFIMKGYTDGGMEMESIPYRLKWEKAVKGEYDFDSLTKLAKEQGFGIFPDFDFVFFSGDSMFDGLSLKKHAVKTIDDRYTSKREYSATKQTYISYYELALSPAYFSRFYEKLTSNYLKHDPIGISVATLGSYLNSDFDEDEPFNREDSKQFTIKAFEYLDQNYNKVMTAGGNAYTWKYVDYITDIALDSSRFAQSAASVPFLGMVLHGYVQFAGSAINMEGNIDYAMLKAIESGASLKYILSYQNTNELKEWVLLSHYYSIKYKYWQDDIIKMYNEINDVLSGVQTSVIIDHVFLDGSRVADDDEIIDDAKSLIDEAIALENSLKKADTEAEINAYRDARENLENAIKNTVNNTTYKGAKDQFNNSYAAILQMTDSVVAIDALNTLYREANSYLKSVETVVNNYYLVTEKYRELIKTDATLSETTRAQMLAKIDAVVGDIVSAGNDPQIVVDEVVAKMKDARNFVIALAGDTVGTVVIPEEYTYNLTVKEEKVDERVELQIKAHDSDEYKIVYEEFDNGTKFLLNFNNYKVMVEYNGTTYTLGAYDYIVLATAN